MSSHQIVAISFVPSQVDDFLFVRNNINNSNEFAAFRFNVIYWIGTILHGHYAII